MPNPDKNKSMLDSKKELAPAKTGPSPLKNKIKAFIKNAKTLQGDPHYIAMGMAIGVFIGITPTFPLHTVLAVALALVFRGSKPAAALGVWVGNPITMPFFYFGSYKIGMLILGNSVPFDEKYISIPELLKLGMDVTVALIAGGALLGILPAVCSYFIVRKIFTNIRSRKKTSQ
jgi:uncharacterized protein (DUF2062 family)